jgi:hypothetical protein
MATLPRSSRTTGATSRASTPSPTTRALATARLLLWGRHDRFFEVAEVLSWMHALPRMEAHILYAPHLLLETHASAVPSLMLEFLRCGSPGYGSRNSSLPVITKPS